MVAPRRFEIAETVLHPVHAVQFVRLDVIDHVLAQIRFEILSECAQYARFRGGYVAPHVFDYAELFLEPREKSERFHGEIHFVTLSVAHDEFRKG